MAHVLQLVPRPSTPESDPDRVDIRDVYDFDDLDLRDYAGVSVSGACDQRHLAAREATITAWVKAGGRLLVNGHPLTRFVEGLPKHRKLDFHTPRDLWLTELGSHPIWDGIDRRDVLYNTGVPGQHTFEELERIGVAGFYAHAYLVDLPADATVITGIGQGRLPVDLSYPLGDGEVIVHLGNDFVVSGMGAAVARFSDRTIAYLEAAPIRKVTTR